MKLTFLGTRGYIEARTRRHRMHTALLVSYYGRQVMIDCGEDWSEQKDKVPARAILLTHAHPDHAGGLKDSAPAPVYGTEETWERLEDYDIKERRLVELRKPVEIEGINFTATAVQLRFDVANSPSLPDPVRERLTRLAGSRMTAEGVLIIEARQFRTQEQNRQEARDRLAKLIRQAAKKKKARRKTSPTRASREQRLRKKRQRGEIKRLRQSRDRDWS